MSPKRIELIVSLFIVLVLGWVLWEARAWQFHSRLFPWSVGFCVLGLALIQLAFSLRDYLRFEPTLEVGPQRTPLSEAVLYGQVTSEPEVVRGRIIVICAWILGFYLGLWFLGFKLGSLILTFAFLRFTAKERRSVSATVAIMSYLFFLAVFDLILAMPLTSGLIAELIGASSLESFVIDILRWAFLG